MRVLFRFLVLIAALAVPHFSAPAAPTTADIAPVTGPLSIPFDPPIGQKLRYRAQKSDEKDGRARLSWEIYDASFQKVGDGYQLTITPVDSGTDGEKSAAQIAFENRIKELTKRPFVVKVTEDGTISGVVDEAKLWADIEKAVAAAVAESKDETERKALQFVSNMFKDMPPEARTGLLIKDLQPLVEFAAADLEEAADILPFEFETASAFNTKTTMEGTISVLGADEEVAVFSIVSRISPDSLKKMTSEMFSKLPVDPAKRKEAEASIAALKHMRHENRSEYMVSRTDGMLLKFTANEEISVEAEGKNDHRITTKTLTRVD